MNRRTRRETTTEPPMPASRILEILDEVSRGVVPAEAWVKWLSAEMKEDLYARLDQVGRAPETAVPLSRVFIDVTASEMEGDEPDVWAFEYDGAIVFDRAVLTASDRAVLTASEKTRVLQDARTEGVLKALLDTPPVAATSPGAFFRRLHEGQDLRDEGLHLLIGGPGQGKSTLSQFLCQMHRAALLGSGAARLDSTMERVFSAFDDDAKALGLSEPTAVCLPLRVVLRDFAAWLFREEPESSTALAGFLAARISRLSGADVSANHVLSAIEQVPWLLVLDGLDEVPMSGGREQILSAVQSFLDGEAASVSPRLVLATTRSQGYGGELGDFSELRLQGLSKGRMTTYATRLVRARYPENADRQSEIIDRLEAAWNEDMGRKLLRTPLQVTLMAELAATVGRIPGDRWKLFSDYYRVMYQRETERPNLQQGELLRRLKAQITQVHQRAGLWLQIRSETAGGTGALLSQVELRGLIDGVLAVDYEEPGERSALVEGVLRAAMERLVFLVHTEEGHYGFEIRPLQEWMAAEALLSGRDEDVQMRLRYVAPVGAWQNVVLFAAGKCFAEVWHLASFIVEGLCEWLNDGCEIPIVRESLVGSEIALDILEDGAAREQKSHARKLGTIALRLLDLPASPLHDRLARVGVRELGPALRKALETKLAMGNTAWRLGAWRALLTAMDEGADWALPLAEAAWPQSASEQRDLLAAVRLLEIDSWVSDGRERSLSSERWLIARIEASPLNFSPSFLRTLRLWPNDDLAHPYFAFVHYLGDYYHGVDSTLHVHHEGRDTGIRGAFWRIEETGDWVTNMADAPTGHAGAWGPVVAAARFAKNPTVEQLAMELRALAENVQDEVPNEYAYLLPWPLAQALCQSQTASDLRALSNDLLAGKYGHGDALVAAENAWTCVVEVRDLLDIAGFWPLPGAPGFRFPLQATFSFFTSPHGPFRSLLAEALAAFHASAAEKQYAAAWLIRELLIKIHEDETEGPVETASPSLSPEVARAVEAVLHERLPQRDPVQIHRESVEIDQAIERDRARAAIHTSLADPSVSARLHLPPSPQPKRSPSDPAPSPGIFRLESLSVSDFRPFQSLSIHPPATPESAFDSGQWLILVGENGVGKSTLLRGLVFALGDTSAATGALAKSPAPYRRDPDSSARVEVTCSTGTFSATISRDPEGGRETLHFGKGDGGRRPFLAAYGCQRGSALGGPNQEASFTPESDVVTLFDETRGLLHSEMWLTRLWVGAQKEPEGLGAAIFETVVDVLRRVLALDSIDVQADAVWVMGKGTGRARLAALSDGYLTTAGWVIDLMARWIDRARRMGQDVPARFNESMEGLALVDEVDLHLHPRWQLRVLSDLRGTFPRMSFVVTTHHSLTLLGARPGEIFVLVRDKVSDLIAARQIDLEKGLRADQVLTGEWFGLASTLDPDTLRLLEKHRMLLRSKAPEQNPERRELEAELRKRLGSYSDTAMDRLVQSVAAELIDETDFEPTPAERVALRDRIKEIARSHAARKSQVPEPGRG